MDKSLLSGSTALLLLKLLESGDMYGYQMIEELSRRSDNTFAFKAGTLYPVLHSLEEKDWVSAYEGITAGRTRRYYHLTEKGRHALVEKETEWKRYADAVHQVLKGGVSRGEA